MIPLHEYRSPYKRGDGELEETTLSLSLLYRKAMRNRRTSAVFALIFFLAIGYFLLPASERTSDLPPPTGYSKTRPDYTKWPVERRAEAVKEAFGHAYASYERFAMPADELKPLRNTSQQK